MWFIICIFSVLIVFLGFFWYFLGLINLVLRNPKMETRKSIEDTAKLVLINAKLYGKERGREVSRYRISPLTLKRISNRQALREGFLDKLADELAELGWTFIKLDDEFAIICSNKIESWVKISSKRLTANKYLKQSSRYIDDLFYKKYQLNPDLVDSDLVE